MIPQPIDQVPLFVRLSEEERELVTARLHRRQAASGELIFTKGRPSDALFVITSGWIKLEEGSPARPIALANLGAGSLAGEIDTLLGRPYTTSARAAATTQLLVLSRTDLDEIISEQPSIGLKFSATLGMRIAFLEQYLIQHRLRNIDLLSSLAEDDLRAIAQKLDFRSCPRGEIIVEANAPGEAVFLIEEGEVRSVSNSNDGECFEDLGEGDIFGHTALITGKPYPATVRAVTDTSVWYLPRSVYLELIAERPAIKLAFSRALAETLGPGDQTEAVEQIRRLPLFSDVPTEALSNLVSRLVLRHFPAGDIIYQEGTPGDALYVVEAGEVKLLDSAFSDAVLLERLHAGDSFGEMALLTGRTRAECARATSDATIWVLYKTDFDDLMVQFPEISVSLSRALTERLTSRENDFLVRHLRRISLFANLTTSELRGVSSKIRGLRFRPGEIICFAGQPAHNMFMIEMGEVKRTGMGPSGEPFLVDLLGPGDSFGEQAIVQDSAHTTTAQALGDVELWTIAKSDFVRMMEQYPTLAVTVTRLIADRLSRGQSTPRSTAPRNTPPTHPGQPFSRGAVSPRPNSPLPRSRIQQPQSGARPIAKPAPPRTAKQFTDNDPTVNIPPMRTMPAMPQADRSADSTVILPRSNAEIAQAPTVRIPPTAAPRRARRADNQFSKELITWLAGLSWGAKFRMTALTGLVAWFAFVAFPATAITTVSSAVGGLQVFNPAPAQNGTPAASKPVALLRTNPGGQSNKVAYAVFTQTPVPTRTPLPPTPTRPRPTSPPVVRVPTQPAAPVVAAAAPAAPVPALPPIYWDQRIGNGNQVLPHLESVKLEPAAVAHGQKFWRAVSVKFEDISESGSDHTIYVKVLGEDGKRVDGKKAHLTSVGGLSEYPDEKPANDLCDCNFNYPMYGDGYGFNIEDQFPSDKVSGMIMPMRRHVNYRIIFQLTTNP